MKNWRHLPPLGAVAMAWAGLHAQTSVDMRTQIKNAGGAARLGVSGAGSKAQTTDGGLPVDAIPAIDSGGKAVDSGCSASAGAARCPNGLNAGQGPGSITMAEGGRPVTVMAAGEQTLYIDEADHRVKLVDSAGVVRVLGSVAGAQSAGALATFDSAGNVTASGCSIASGTLTCRLGAGSLLSIPSWYEFPAGMCVGGAAYLGFNTGAAAPSATCATGANTVFGAASFSGAAQSGQLRLMLPDDWAAGDGNDLEFRFRSAAAGGAGNIVWKAQTACAADRGAALDPAFGAAQTVPVTAQANGLSNSAVIRGLTAGGCAAGNILFLSFGLDGSTTAAGNQELLSIRVRLKRAVAAL